MADKKIDLSHFDEAVKSYDLSAFDKPEEGVGQLKSALLGAAQSATLGFADEGEAGLRSILPESLGGGDYDKLIQDVRSRYKEAEEVNPMSYVGGELAGGLATAAIPGLGPTKAVTALGKGASMLGAGALAGALSSVGGREDDKLSKQAAIDAVKGGLVGGGVGVLVGSALPSAVKYATKGIRGSQIGQDVAEVYSKIKSGEVATFAKESLPGFKKKLEEAAETDILGNLDKIKEHSNASYDNLKNIAKNTDVEIPISEKVAELRAKMPTELQGVTEQDLSTVNKNLGGLLGEQQVAKEIAVPIDSDAAKQKVFLSLQGKAAAGEVTAERNFARKYLQSKYESDMSKVLKGDALTKASKQHSERLTSADIDAAVDEIRSLGLRERTQFPPEFELNPETGLEVGVVKRADADLSQAVPTEKMQKVKETITSKAATNPEELSGRINNLKGLLSDKLKADNPALFKYITDVKNDLQKTLESHLPQEYAKAKDLADATYREALVKAPAKYLGLPENLGTSYKGQANLGEAERDVTRMLGKYWNEPTEDSGRIQKFLDTLKSANADEIGLSSTGKQGPASIADIEKNLHNVSRNMNLAERASGVSALQGAAPPSDAVGVIKRIANFGMQSSAAKTLGAAEYAGNIAKEAERVSKFMHTNTPESIKALASKVTDSKLATILNNAANAPDAKRKAVIFSLMQQPAYRDAINSADEGQ